MNKRNIAFLGLALWAFQLAGQTASGYKAAQFTDTDRMSKIRAAIPEVENIFKAFAQNNQVPGYAFGIVVDGQLVFKGAGGMANLQKNHAATPTSLFRIASMTKSITAMAILQLRDAGKLSLHDPVAKYLPELGRIAPLTADAQPPTIFNLLTMTAGFPEDNPWGDRQLEDSDQDFLDFLREGISFSTTPSSGYEYSNLGYAMLGSIIARITGMPYQKYINETIFKPLGMDHTHWEYEGLSEKKLALGYRWEDSQWKPEPMLHDGVYGAMGGLITTIEDFGKYLAFHLSAWPPRNDLQSGPLGRASVREMHKMTEPRLNAEAKDSGGAPCPVMVAYGYGLRVQKDCKGVLQVAHSGGLPGFGSNFTFLPDYGIGVMLFANRTYAPATAANNLAIQAILRSAGLEPRQLPVSDILARRKDQVFQLLQTWKAGGEGDFLAENFYLDSDLEHRRQDAAAIFAKAGKPLEAGPLVPENQLRGTFRIRCEQRSVDVFFSLSPEKNPKVQALTLRVVE
jgi:CubicO group peptidase (beta-lactamase class C family)